MTRSQEDVAVVGVGCLFPESDSLQDYWSLIKNAEDAITEIPCTHWSPDDYYDEDPKAPDHTYGKTGAFLKPYKFDPLHYGISPQALEATDTTQLLGMVVAEKALENAGYGQGAEFDRDRVSCILGVTGTLEMVIPLGARLGHPVWKKALKKIGLADDDVNQVMAEVSSSYVPWQEASFPGLLGNVVAGRIANRFDLGGTNSVVDAACASSLSAIRTAVMELQSGRADMVLTGGMDTFNDIFMYMCFSKTPALSPTGSARPFDGEGDGTVLGEGLGALVLKRLSDAERDGDRIYGVIKGIGSSSDGRGKAIYAPSAEGQKKALLNAYEDADISPATVELVECHGTGTKVGDGIELSALGETYRAFQSEGRWCTLGSVKSQIGHTKAAAGAAGIIKAVMALYHKVLPPSIKIDSIHPNLEKSPFIIREQASPWLANPKHPRRAAVSAFGFGGSNFHCVLEEYEAKKPMVDHDSRISLWPLAADSQEELREILVKLQDGLSEDNLIRTGRELRTKKLLGNVRLGLMIQHGNHHELIAAAIQGLDGLVTWDDLSKKGIYFGEGTPGALGVVFSGQGAQYPNMLAKMMAQYPCALDSLSDAARVHEDDQLFNILYPGKAFSKDELKDRQTKLAQTNRAQPAIGAVSAGLWKALKSFGLKADLFAGHSFGELTALYAAGVYDEASYHRLAQARGYLMSQAASDLGGMIAIFADINKVRKFLEDNDFDLVVANHNAPEQVVLAGPHEDIKKAKAALKGAGLRGKVLTVGAAFHSPIMEGTVKAFHQELEDVELSFPNKPVYSNSLAAPYSSDVDDIKKVLSGQLAKPVRFVEELESMYEDGARAFLEVGPSRILSGLVDKIFAGRNVHSLYCDDKGEQNLQFYRCLLKLHCLGYALEFSVMDSDWRKDELEDPKFFIPITGANYRAPVQEIINQKKEKVESELVAEPKIIEEQKIVTEDKSVSRNDQGVWQQHLDKIHEIQQKSADLHQQFLSNQAESQKIYWEILRLSQGASVSESSIKSEIPSVSSIEIRNGEAAASFEPAAPLVSEEPAKVPAVETSQEDPQEERAGASGQASASGASQVVMDLISDKTGYPVEMLQHEMALEEDLGIDSIKRVEIFSALQESFPQLVEATAEDLNGLARISDITRFLNIQGNGADVDSTSESSHEKIALEEPKDIPKTDDVAGIIYSVISEKTGYPTEMLNLEMALEEDLGIDSIKRVEIISALQESFPILEDMSAEDLSQVKTIANLLAVLSEGSQETGSKEIISAVSHQNQPEESHLDEKMEESSLSEAVNSMDMNSKILGIISEKTGYPVEMLDAPMSLEGDLGIDSIKRVEIFSALADDSSAVESASQEELAALETIGDLFSFIGGAPEGEGEATEKADLSVGAEAAQLQDEPVEDAPLSADEPLENKDLDAASSEAVELTIPRKVLRYETFKDLEESAKALDAGAVIWVCDDGSNLARNIVLKLREKGYKPKLVSISFVDRLKAPEVLDGLIMLGPVKLDGSPSRFLNNCFKMVKLCGPALRASENSLLTVVTRNGGLFGLEGLDNLSQVYSSAMAGLAKTISHEWETVRAMHIDLARDFSDGFQAAFRFIQACMSSSELELGVFSEHYSRPVLRTELGEEASIDIDEDDIVLITGGARGVTAQVAAALARRKPCHLVLWGRTERKDLEEWALQDCREFELKGILMERENFSSPKELEAAYQSLLRQRELAANIQILEDLGAKVHYQVVDVSVESQMRQAFEEIEGSLGKPTVIIHGAGVIADKLVDHMREDEFLSVLDTKIRLLNVLDQRELEPKYLVMFSSSTGRFGRKGQLAYGVANESLNKFVSYFGAKHPQTRCVAINWGPWQGGMVHDGLAKIFADEGIQTIPLDLGADFFMNELAQSHSAREVVAIAEELGQESGKQEISFKSWPILHSHIIKHKGVVPTVLLMELMSHWALKPYPKMKVGGISKFKILKGITLESEESCRFQISLEKPHTSSNGLLITATIFSQKQDDDHWYKSAVGDVLLVDEYRNDANAPEIQVAGTIEKPSIDDVYGEYLFHGEELQGLTSIAAIDEDGIIGSSVASPTPDTWLKEGDMNSWNMDPLVIDVAFQLGVIWSEKVCGVRSLPTGFRDFRQYQTFPKHGCDVRMKITKRSESSFTSSIEFVHGEELVACLEGYEAIMDESLSSSFRDNDLVMSQTSK